MAAMNRTTGTTLVQRELRLTLVLADRSVVEVMNDRDVPPVVVRCFPSADHAFARAAHEALETIQGRSGARATLQAAVDGELRTIYPNSRIVAQDVMATIGQPVVIWYAYRDGRVRKPDPRRDRIYAAVATARDTVKDSRAVMDNSRSIARSAGFEERPPLPGPPLNGPQRPAKRIRTQSVSGPRPGQAED
jgi:hypothetical protein